MREILAFLQQNPEACDAVEGISTYWVTSARRRELEVALRELTEAGQLTRVTIGGREHYTRA